MAQAEAGSLDMTGGGNTIDGGILRTQNTVGGTSYTRPFYVGNIDGGDTRCGQQAGIDHYINNTLVAATPTHTNAATNGNLTNWLLQTYTFTASGPVTVIALINATNAADSYAGLDSVSFNPTVAAVPEPSTCALIGGSILRLAVFRRRKA